MLYRDEPILQAPFKLLTKLIDIDQSLNAWRYGHALLAQRMIGTKIGSGGSSGSKYLKRTLEKHSIFDDYVNLSGWSFSRGWEFTFPSGSYIFPGEHVIV